MSLKVFDLVTCYDAHQNLKNAQEMSAYMRNKFAFFGIKTPARKLLSKRCLKDFGEPKSLEDIEQLARDCFAAPQRELQYFVGDWLKPKAKRLSPEILPLLEELIITKSWWDTVDFLSPSIAGVILAQDSALWPKFPDRWISSSNLWLRRAAILWQLKRKQETDDERLFYYCSLCRGEEEFFIQKAMGWALRERSKTNESSVHRFLESNQMPPLTEREALKWLRNKGLSN